MKVDIRDMKAISSLRPLEVAAYLKSRSWAQQKVSATVSIWTKGTGDEMFEAAVPLDQSLKDYAIRMGEIVQTLAVAEGRSQADVYSDLLTTYADVIRIRIVDPELDDGTLPIEANAQIAQKARDLLLAAACSAKEPRAVWHTRKPTQAVEQVRRLRIGQSERGSYVISVISRVDPTLQPTEREHLFEPEPPFERQVTLMLASSLATLDEAAATAALSQEFKSFDDAIAKGVSANLCDAVAGLCGEDDRNRELEFIFSWSPARPIDGAVPSRVKFGSDRIPVIREASRLLRERAPFDEFELEGAVVKLDRAPEQSIGKVTVIGVVEGKPHRVLLELPDPHYSLAIKAHEQQQPFRCFGTLVREGRSFVLRDARDFAIEAD